MSRKSPEKPGRPGQAPQGFVIGGALGANAGVGDWFEKKILRLCADMSEETIDEVTRLFEKAGRSSQARILLNRLGDAFAPRFEARARTLAEGMLKRALKAEAAGLRVSLKDLAQGVSIKPNWISGALKEKLKAAVTENVSLIRGIGQRQHSQVTEAVMRSLTTGQGMKDLVPELRRIGAVSARRARFIARDQTRKAASFITAERFRSAGIRYFQWVHSNRARTPRPLHEAFNGRIFSLLPGEQPVIDLKTGERGLPGQLINCRCRMAPALATEYLEQDNAEVLP